MCDAAVTSNEQFLSEGLSLGRFRKCSHKAGLWALTIPTERRPSQAPTEAWPYKLPGEVLAEILGQAGRSTFPRL